MLYVSIGFAILILIISVRAIMNNGWNLFHQRLIGGLIICYGIYLSLLSGSYTSLVLPGIGSIVLGGGAGAAVGFATWLFLGTVGVATGGVGVAIGVGAMALIGSVVGGIGGAVGGFGLQTVTYPLVSPFFWVPIIILGIYFMRGKRIKKQQILSLPNPEGDGT